MVAAAAGRFDAVEFLLEQGADYRTINEAGYTLADRVGRKRGLMRPGTDQMRDLERVVHWLNLHDVVVPE
jgi:hypothetical protein